MKVLGIRHCVVSPHARAMSDLLGALGLPQRHLEFPAPDAAPDGFAGAIYLAGDSWVELWPPGPQMPEGTMLQVVVDDADAFAAQARANGLAPDGPMDMFGERLYFLKTPDGGQLSFQSAAPAGG